MLVNYALVKRTVVYNVAIVNDENQEAVQMLIDMGGILIPEGQPVGVGDIYENGQFYREDDIRGLVPMSEWEVWEYNKNLAIYIVDGNINFSGLLEEDKENVKKVLEYFVKVGKITQDELDELLMK